MRGVARIALLLGILVPGIAACQNGRSAAPPTGSAPAAANGPRVVLHTGTGNVAVRVELARSDAERSRGLMFRKQMDSDAGMLFIFENDGPLTFWMKNTLIPLDMIFIDHDRRIVGIVEDATPETETPRRVQGESRYVLEIGGGLARKWGISSGSQVGFEGVPADARPQ